MEEDNSVCPRCGTFGVAGSTCGTCGFDPLPPPDAGAEARALARQKLTDESSPTREEP